MVDLTQQEKEKVLSAADWINKRRTLMGFIVLGMVVTLGAIVMYLWLVLVPRIDENTHRSQKTQCQFYSLVLTGGYRPETRIVPTDPPEEQKRKLAEYNFGYAGIVEQNNGLNCVRANEPQEYITDPAKVTTTTVK